jgi:hypothetical protein
MSNFQLPKLNVASSILAARSIISDLPRGRSIGSAIPRRARQGGALSRHRASGEMAPKKIGRSRRRFDDGADICEIYWPVFVAAFVAPVVLAEVLVTSLVAEAAMAFPAPELSASLVAGLLQAATERATAAVPIMRSLLRTCEVIFPWSPWVMLETRVSPIATLQASRTSQPRD